MGIMMEEWKRGRATSRVANLTVSRDRKLHQPPIIRFRVDDHVQGIVSDEAASIATSKTRDETVLRGEVLAGTAGRKGGGTKEDSGEGLHSACCSWRC